MCTTKSKCHILEEYLSQGGLSSNFISYDNSSIYPFVSFCRVLNEILSKNVEKSVLNESFWTNNFHFIQFDFLIGEALSTKPNLNHFIYF